MTHSYRPPPTFAPPSGHHLPASVSERPRASRPSVAPPRRRASSMLARVEAILANLGRTAR